ncbi:MAG: hypothetical protein HY925_08595 [Elusimicrobia bacterium]|nr:hypothetical protein [Elusimicrobiota bacterium]
MIHPAVLALLLCAPALNAQTLEEAQASAGQLLAQRPTALQKHIRFFDKDGNGTITRAETTLGLRELGLGRAKAAGTALVIHVFLGAKTTGDRLSLDISVANIKLGKHGSDTGVYDAAGELVPEAFERMFAEFDVNKSGSLSAPELKAMTAANAKLRPGDSGASDAEFDLLLEVAADAQDSGGKAISRARLRQFYDGTLLYNLAKPLS